MLVIKKSEYEVEEKITLLNERDEEIYSFEMKLTSDDLRQLKEALIGKDTIRLSHKIKQLESVQEEESDRILELAEEMNFKIDDMIGKLCFKEHKDKFIELGGISKYNEMVEIITDFLLITFMKKQTKRIDIINTDLAGIMNK